MCRATGVTVALDEESLEKEVMNRDLPGAIWTVLFHGKPYVILPSLLTLWSTPISHICALGHPNAILMHVQESKCLICFVLVPLKGMHQHLGQEWQSDHT